MAASGVSKTTCYQNMRHVTELADFAFALKNQIEDVNTHSYNNFKMRIGMLLCYKKIYPLSSFKVTLQVSALVM